VAFWVWRRDPPPDFPAGDGEEEPQLVLPRRSLPDTNDGTPLLGFSPDNRTFVTSDESMKTVQLWDIVTGKQRCSLVCAGRVPKSPWEVIFSPDSQVLALDSGVVGPLTLWDVQSGQCRHILGGENCFPSFSADGGLIATFPWESRKLRLWKVATGEEVTSLLPKREGVYPFFAPRGDVLVLLLEERKVLELWKVREKRKLATLRGDFKTETFSHDGRLLAIGDDKTIRLCDTRTRKVTSLDAGPGEVGALAFNPSDSRLASMSADKDPKVVVRLWNVPDDRE
jgi:WD40 repeat protein